MHAYGAAIDLNLAYSDYWLWEKGAPYRNRVPDAIVAIFERHGFIWGGKWQHFDTMHFEYRPELIGLGLVAVGIFLAAVLWCGLSGGPVTHLVRSAVGDAARTNSTRI